ncbi:hypothetical protein WOB59_06540 [Methylocystis sp. IM4]|uniref:hypothetical protein n=1 Tax=Methylocystis sp. IM4 TaxID=3136560 RepID=UPI00311A4F4C
MNIQISPTCPAHRGPSNDIEAERSAWLASLAERACRIQCDGATLERAIRAGDPDAIQRRAENVFASVEGIKDAFNAAFDYGQHPRGPSPELLAEAAREYP